MTKTPKKLSVKEVEGFDEYMSQGFHDHTIKFPEAENTQFESGFDTAQEIAKKFIIKERQRVVEMIESMKNKEHCCESQEGAWCEYELALSDLQSKLGENHAK